MGIWIGIVGLLLLWSGQAWSQVTGTRPHRGFQHFNKLAVRNYLPCGGNNVLTGWVNHTDPQCQQLTLSWLADAAQVVTLAGAQRLSEKQVDPVEVPLAIDGSNNVAINTDLGNVFILDAIPVNITFLNPTGTGGNPQCSQDITLRLKSTSPRTLSWSSQYVPNGFPLPTVTVGDGTTRHFYKFRFDCTTTEWLFIASNQNTGTTPDSRNLPLTGIKLHATAPTGPSVAGINTVIWFDENTTQCVLWETTLPGDYLGQPVLRFWYKLFSDNNPAHSANFDVRIWAQKAGDDLDMPTWSTINDCDDLNIPSVLGRYNEIACALNNNDGMAANDPIQIEVCGDAPSGSWLGLLGLHRVRFEYVR